MKKQMFFQFVAMMLLVACSCSVARHQVSGQPAGQAVPSLSRQNDCAGQPLLAARLHETRLRPLPLGAIKPAGWLRNQLEIEAAGLAGQLDTFWPPVKDSAWFGGKDDGWERAPYWLDGAVPLAWLVDDAALKARITRYMDYILTHQNKAGWIGPARDNLKGYDLWAIILAFKPLVQYYELTGDERVVPVLDKALKQLNVFLDNSPLEGHGYLYNWGYFRWFDALIPTLWLYEKTGDPKLMELAIKIKALGFDWTSFYQYWPLTQPTPPNGWTYLNHGVNNAMALRLPAFWWRISGAESDLRAGLDMLEKLDRYHGTVWGGVSCDECIVGKNPIQGTELCSVVEFMNSLEYLIAATGEPTLGDRLEKVAFNALPATCSPDMWTHQYLQQVNQVQCVAAADAVWHNSGPEAILFGVEPACSCCTANMAQGWPKLAAHLWMRTREEGLAAVVYAPCVIDTQVRGVGVNVEVATEYPFRDRVTVTVKVDRPVRFPLNLRIPAWTKDATVKVNGRKAGHPAPGEFLTLDRKWQGESKLELRFPMAAQGERRYNNALAITRGPLVYSLKIGEEWKWVNRERPYSKPPHQDWEIRPTTPWNYALALDEHSLGGLVFAERPVGKLPFSPAGAPLAVNVPGARVSQWGIEHASATSTPVSPVKTDQPIESITLIPYGCTNLRVTEFPTTK